MLKFKNSKLISVSSYNYIVRNYVGSNLDGRKQQEEVEKDWFKPNQVLKKYHDDLIAKELPHVVYLEGPSGSGKAQLLERLHKLGYETIAQPYLHFTMEPVNQKPSKTQQTNWANDINNQINRFLQKKQSIKNGLIFVHRSPLFSSTLYSNLCEFEDVDKAVSHINSEYKENSNNNDNYGESIIYCKTPEELIEQRVQGRYFNSDDVDINKTMKALKQSIDVYDRIEKENNIFRATLDTTSVKQSCPGILAMFDIYFTLSPKFQSILNLKK
ncbi:hypothetical protein PPL_02652 [Heterostelium album PN500]|uniref:Uncharacterized protein n=1 Tax=Heterostelium pallidum (strain ATCC 26659 / Pp 5 / PN500) TaxID=670386 RepID=D3B2N8_HETP5|nr:hypothetical protein PPL_02652 [Heterostelium album PN500]EFA83586.1 hypothetical protein PPL_02652 [Heterostelium album PN500]|eukprot:XP_020435703.1 hypothetical protein PPL_02652 [Heterostelium album PN500]